MRKSFSILATVSCLCLVGCSGGDPGQKHSATAPSASPNPGNAAVDGPLSVFAGWQSADGPARLAMIEGSMDEKKHARWLENYFVGRPVEELKQVFGEPDLAEEQTRRIAGRDSTYLYYFYYLGATTKDTPREEQDLIEWRTDTLRGTLRVKNLRIRLRRISAAE